MEKINCSLLFKVLKLRSTPGTILELIFTNLVKSTQDISGGKKITCPQPWNDKRKQNKGAKASDLADVKKVCHHCTCTAKERTPGKSTIQSLDWEKEEN